MSNLTTEKWGHRPGCLGLVFSMPGARSLPHSGALWGTRCLRLTPGAPAAHRPQMPPRLYPSCARGHFRRRLWELATTRQGPWASCQVSELAEALCGLRGAISGHLREEGRGESAARGRAPGQSGIPPRPEPTPLRQWSPKGICFAMAFRGG